jgi:hypothetical protein
MGRPHAASRMPHAIAGLHQIAYVALYFAVEEMAERNASAVWAINSAACDERAIMRIGRLQKWRAKPLLSEEDLSKRDVAGMLSSASLFSRAFLGNKFSLVCTVQPARHNTRMDSQQGCFLCPGDLTNLNGFEANLLAQLTLGIDPEYFFPVWNPPQIFKFIIPGQLKGLALRELRRMNINRASLFPGLDGFSKSLMVELDLTPATEIG